MKNNRINQMIKIAKNYIHNSIDIYDPQAHGSIRDFFKKYSYGPTEYEYENWVEWFFGDMGAGGGGEFERGEKEELSVGEIEKINNAVEAEIEELEEHYERRA